MEPPDYSSCSSASAEHLVQAESRERDSDGRRPRTLQYNLQQHLRHIEFQDESRGSEFNDNSVSFRNAPRGSARSLELPVKARASEEEIEEPDQLQLQHEPGDPNEGSEEQPETGQTSQGSHLHDAGKCKPCHYVHTKLGCLNGEDCNFCHIPHTKKSRPRPCKTKRMQCKRIVSMLEAATAKDPGQFAEATKVLSSQSSYLRSVLNGKLKDKGADLATTEEQDVANNDADNGRDAREDDGVDALTAVSTEAESPGDNAVNVPPSKGATSLVPALLNKLKGASQNASINAAAKSSQGSPGQANTVPDS